MTLPAASVCTLRPASVKSFDQVRSPDRFMKRGRRYFGDADLLLGDGGSFACELGQRLPYPRVGGDRGGGRPACPNYVAHREYSHSREDNAQQATSHNLTGA